MSVELFVGLVVLVGAGYWLYTRNSKKSVVVESTPAPYKVETPVSVAPVVEAVKTEAPVAEAKPKAKTKTPEIL